MVEATQVLPFGETAIAAAAALIRAGQPVAVPTETVYGLAADATNGEAVARIYAAKGRPSFNPLIVHVRDLAHAEMLGVFDDTARALAAEHWPGPLTLVLPRRDDSGLASLATAGLATVALRCPAHRAMRALLDATGLPLAAPSANASGAISPTRADHVLRTLNGQIALIIDDGATLNGIESTIVSAEDGRIRLLRPGPVTIPAAADFSHDQGAIVAPGQLPAHYAPVKPLRMNARAVDPDEWHIGFGGVVGNVSLSLTGDLQQAASRLFCLLHDADVNSFDRIAVAPVPNNGVGIAINDRLERAVAGSGNRR
jgi:L-threonylcarbamoyladenylate synthase